MFVKLRKALFVIFADFVGAVKRIFKLHFFLADVLSSKFDYVASHTQFACNCKRVTAARYTHNKAISRRERCKVEFHRGILHAVGRKRVFLQLFVVGGNYRFCPASAQKVRNGKCQRGSFVRFRACSHFVYQHKVALAAHVKYITQIGDMSRKSRQILFNTLFVADVTEDVVEVRHAAFLGTRHKKPCHRHCRHKPDGLQRHGFAAGVGTRNYDNVVIAPHFHRNGHDLCFVKQRMASFLEIDITFVVHQRQSTLVFYGVLHLTENHVNVADCILRVGDPCGKGRNTVGKRLQNALNFRLFLKGRFTKRVVELHDCHRFDKQRCTRSRLVVNNAVDVTFVFRLDRDYVSVTAHGYDCVLHILCRFAVFGVTLQFRLDVGIDCAYFFAYSKQVCAGFVIHFVLGQNGKVNVIFKGFVVKQTAGNGAKHGRVYAVVHKQRRLQIPGRAQRAHDLQTLPHRKATTHASQRTGILYVVHRQVE